MKEKGSLSSPQDCLFCGMELKTSRVGILKDFGSFVVIRDKKQNASLHLLAIPKEHIEDSRFVSETHFELLCSMEKALNDILKGHPLSKNGTRFKNHNENLKTREELVFLEA